MALIYSRSALRKMERNSERKEKGGGCPSSPSDDHAMNSPNHASGFPLGADTSPPSQFESDDDSCSPPSTAFHEVVDWS